MAGISKTKRHGKPHRASRAVKARRRKKPDDPNRPRHLELSGSNQTLNITTGRGNDDILLIMGAKNTVTVNPGQGKDNIGISTLTPATRDNIFTINGDKDDLLVLLGTNWQKGPDTAEYQAYRDDQNNTVNVNPDVEQFIVPSSEPLNLPEIETRDRRPYNRLWKEPGNQTCLRQPLLKDSWMHSGWNGAWIWRVLDKVKPTQTRWLAP